MYVIEKRPGLIKKGEVVTHLNYETQQARPGLSDDCKEIWPVHPKGDQSWVFTGRTDVEAETIILWPPDAKSWLIGKDPDAGRGWGQEEKGTTEDEMAGWHHQLDWHESEWTLGVGDGQGGLACCNSWDCKESDTTERLNWTENGNDNKKPINKTDLRLPRWYSGKEFACQWRRCRFDPWLGEEFYGLI